MHKTGQLKIVPSIMSIQKADMCYQDLLLTTEQDFKDHMKKKEKDRTRKKEQENKVKIKMKEDPGEIIMKEKTDIDQKVRIMAGVHQEATKDIMKMEEKIDLKEKEAVVINATMKVVTTENMETEVFQETGNPNKKDNIDQEVEQENTKKDRRRTIREKVGNIKEKITDSSNLNREIDQ